MGDMTTLKQQVTTVLSEIAGLDTEYVNAIRNVKVLEDNLLTKLEEVRVSMYGIVTDQGNSSIEAREAIDQVVAASFLGTLANKSINDIIDLSIKANRVAQAEEEVKRVGGIYAR